MQTYDPNKSTTETRQANSSKTNLRVLIFSAIAVIVLFAIIFAVSSMNTPSV